ncbi:MAG: hypothetical protein R2695_12015, partial [Acidimicrobiales bacterium]
STDWVGPEDPTDGDESFATAEPTEIDNGATAGLAESTIDLDHAAERIDLGGQGATGEEEALDTPVGAADIAYVGAVEVGAGRTGPPRLVTAADLDGASAGRYDSDAGPATAPMAVIEETSLFAEADRFDDPFLDQLRDVVDREPDPHRDDEALSAFFDQEEDEGGRSWFGRRR